MRGSCKAVIMAYIRIKYPRLLPLYQNIYDKRDRSYWEMLDEELKDFAVQRELDYVTNDDSIRRPFEAPPVIVNYFYHEQIRKSAGKGGHAHA